MRPKLSPGALYTRLQAEFRLRRPPGCDKCRVPLPYLIERPDEVSANWRIGTPQACVHKCDVILAEIAAALWPQYDLSDPVSLPVRQLVDLRSDVTFTDTEAQGENRKK